MVHAHKQQASHEGAKDLRKNVVGDLFPRKALPDGKADGNGWVEVTAGGGGAGDDGEGDADGEGPADFEEGAEGGVCAGC